SSPHDVPGFDQLATLQNVSPSTGPAPVTPSWLQDHVVVLSPQQKSQEQTLPSVDQSWVLDFVAPATAPPEFSGDLMLSRILLYACLICTVSLLVIGWRTQSLAFAFGLAGAFLVCIRQYKSEAVVHSRARSYEVLRETELELKAARKAVEALE